jgi:hypothetical protein
MGAPRVHLAAPAGSGKTFVALLGDSTSPPTGGR